MDLSAAAAAAVDLPAARAAVAVYLPEAVALDLSAARAAVAVDLSAAAVDPFAVAAAVERPVAAAVACWRFPESVWRWPWYSHQQVIQCTRGCHAEP